MFTIPKPTFLVDRGCMFMITNNFKVLCDTIDPQYLKVWAHRNWVVRFWQWQTQSQNLRGAFWTWNKSRTILRATLDIQVTPPFSPKERFNQGPRGIWTPVAGFKVQSDNHYTIRPAWGMNPVGMEARRQAPTMGLEPTISPWGGVRRIHWATRADWKQHGTTTCAEFKFFFVKKKTWTEQDRFR